jgi:TRAP-type C4-dicarboxylate transport system permease small subunit
MKILKWIDDHIEEALLTIVFSVMVSVIFVQVIARLLDNSLSWSEELGRYCFIWLVYLGISYGVKKQRHISVDVMLVILKGKARIVLSLIANIIFLVFSLIVVRYGSDIALKLLAFGQKSPALHIPMGIVYMASPIGMGLAAIRLIQNITRQIKALMGKIDAEKEAELERA